MDLLRDIEGKPYEKVDGMMTCELCELIGLPRRKDGTYRVPSVGRLNTFVLRDWPLMSGEFELEFAIAAIDRELALGRKVVVTIDSTPLEASRFNFDAQFNVHYAVRMDHRFLTRSAILDLMRGSRWGP